VRESLALLEMYKAPIQFSEPEEVKDFHRDSEKLGILYDLNGWYITKEWSLIFKEHFNKILVLAEGRNPWAQYNIGNIYFGGYLYSSQEDFEKNYESDLIEGSKWFEKAARQGFVAAVDTLVVVGVGSEAERLRTVAKDVEKEHPEFIQKREGNEYITPSLFEAVWDRAYGRSS